MTISKNFCEFNYYKKNMKIIIVVALLIYLFGVTNIFSTSKFLRYTWVSLHTLKINKHMVYYNLWRIKWNSKSGVDDL